MNHLFASYQRNSATGDGAEIFCAAFGTGGVPPFGADVAGADVAGADATVEVAAPGL